MSAARIGVGVPVWQGAAFVAETLDSVLSQRDVAVDVFICIDGADRESEQACRPFGSDPRVRIVVQPQRLGWGENCAAALAGAAATGAPYVCLQPHDDLVDSDYLQSLVEVAEARPEAVVVYSDIRAFGSYNDLIVQPDITGTPIERQLSLLRCFHAVPFRGLTRAAALSRVPAMAGNSYGDFACDLVWLARLARAGDLVRVPRALYRKRYHAANTYMEWHAWSFEQRTEAWLHHCLDVLAEALCVCPRYKDADRVVAAARARLLDDSASAYRADLARLAPAERANLLRRFEDGVACVRNGPLARSAGDRLRQAWRRVVGLGGLNRGALRK